MKRNLGRIIILLSLVLAVGTGLIAYQQTERFNQTQVNFALANATVVAMGTMVVELEQADDGTLVAIAQDAQRDIDAVRGSASTLQAGSIGTRTALETEIAAIGSSATEAAHAAATQVAQGLDDAATTQAALVESGAATQASQEQALEEERSARGTAQADLDTLQVTSTANAELIATQDFALRAVMTVIALDPAITPTAQATPRVSATPTSDTGETVTNPVSRRDALLRAFPVPIVAGDVEWSIADDPQTETNARGEATLALLLTNDSNERAVIVFIVGSDSARLEAGVEQASTALNLQPVSSTLDDFPQPNVIGSSAEALEAIWVQDSTFVRVIVLDGAENGEAKLIALARSVLEFLNNV